MPKNAFTQRGRARRASGPPARNIAAMIRYSSPRISTPSRKPKNGEVTIGRKTFHSRPLFEAQPSPPSFDQISAPQLLCAAERAAPHRPPINACDDEDGRPRHHVIRFQTIAPSSAQIRTCDVIATTSVSTRPDEIVFATAVPAKAPMRLVTAARITAWPGDRIFGATTVAIELAVSWKPLMNSKISANATTSNRSVNMRALRWSAVLQRDRIGDHAGFAATVDGFFQDLEEFLQQEHLARIQAAGIDLAVQFEDEAVGLGLEHAQAVVERLHRFQAQVLEFADHFHHHAGRLFEHRGARGEVDVLQPVARERVTVGEAFDLLRDLVQGRGERLDVFTLDRGNEAVDQRLADLVAGLALALARQLEGFQARGARRRTEHLVQRDRAVVRRDRRIVEQGVELLALSEDRLQGEHAGGLGVWVAAKGRNYDSPSYDKRMTQPGDGRPGRGPRRRRGVRKPAAMIPAAPPRTPMDDPRPAAAAHPVAFPRMDPACSRSY